MDTVHGVGDVALCSSSAKNSTNHNLMCMLHMAMHTAHGVGHLAMDTVHNVGHAAMDTVHGVGDVAFNTVNTVNKFVNDGFSPVSNIVNTGFNFAFSPFFSNNGGRPRNNLFRNSG